MADEASKEGASPLPPKLDLRKSGILKSVPPPAPMAEDAATMVPAAAAPAPIPVAPVAPAPVVSTPAPAAAPASAIRVDAKPAAAPVSGPRPTPGGAAPRPAGAPAPGQPWRPGSGAGAPAPKPMGNAPTGIRREGTPGAAPAPAPVVTPAGAPKPLITKKDTSRIPLEAAKPRVEKVMPVTGVELSKPGGPEVPSTVKIMRPGETAQIAGLPRPVDVASAEKRKTSRISLDSVLSEGAASESSGPKTIRLKRPGEGPTSKVPGAGAADDSGEDVSEPSAGPTQRKTVVVKRTQEAASARKLSVARPAAGASASAPTTALGPDVLNATVTEPHWSFGVIAIAATLVLCVVIYLFASQAIGPNSSMLQYSSWTGGPNLAWPGKTAWNP